jgi:hypothetical protein
MRGLIFFAVLIAVASTIGYTMITRLQRLGMPNQQRFLSGLHQ